MINIKVLYLFSLLGQTVSEDVRSILLNTIINTRYQCYDSRCSSFLTPSVLNLWTCQVLCLNSPQCYLVTFDPFGKQCEIVDKISFQYGNMTAQIGFITMTTIDSRQLTTPASMITTQIFITGTGTSTTSSTTTTTTSNPCVSGSSLWNKTGITLLGSSLRIAAEDMYFDVNDTLYVADEYSNFVVWKVLKNAVNATVAAGTYQSQGSSSSQLDFPNGVYVDRYENIYVTDAYNHRVQKFVRGSTSGITVAGTTGSAGSSLSQLNTPRYVTFDSTETYIYVSDYNNQRVLRFSTNSTSGTDGVLVAGGTGAFNTNTSLNAPWGITSSPSVTDDLFIVNFGGHSVMRWTPGAPSGVPIAGIPGVAGSNSTLLNSPIGIRVDSYLNIYVVDSQNHRVQMFCPNSPNGITVAGTGSAGNTATQLNGPRGLAFDSAMNMYVADFQNYRIQKFLKL